MFVAECVAVQDAAESHVSRRGMYDRFCRWWAETGEQPGRCLSMNMLARRLKGLGLSSPKGQFRVNGVKDRWWVGVKLTDVPSNVVKMPGLSHFHDEKGDKE